MAYVLSVAGSKLPDTEAAAKIVWPLMTRLAAVTLLVTVNDLLTFKLPAKLDEPVPLPV